MELGFALYELQSLLIFTILYIYKASVEKGRKRESFFRRIKLRCGVSVSAKSKPIHNK